MTSEDWQTWEDQWRTGGAPEGELRAMVERARRARRAGAALRALSAAVAAIALAVVAALRHAGNRFEVALGLVVGLGIAAVWLLDARDEREAVEALAAPADAYRTARAALCRRRIRFARLGWIVVALDLAFLIPWWIGGLAVHGAGFHAMHLLTMWLPLALMAGFVAWTRALHRRAAAELEQIRAEPAEE